MSHALPSIRIAVAFATIATAVAGCTAANNATSSQASAQGEQPYKTMYGLSSEGTTTDLYTEIFGARQPPPAPAGAAVASNQPPQQPITAQPITPVQPAPARPPQAATAPSRQAPVQSATNRAAPAAIQPVPVQPAPVQVAQQPAPPPKPEEPDVPTMYGITANGPSTDLYTMIFGRRDGQ